MPIPTAEFVKRLDKITDLHESALQNIVDIYEIYQNLLKQEDDMKKLQATTGNTRNEEIDKKIQMYLARIQETKADVEQQLKKCMNHIQDVGELKTFTEQVIAFKVEKDMNRHTDNS